MYTAFLLILFHFDLTGIPKYLFPRDFAINEILQFPGLSFHLWVCRSCVFSQVYCVWGRKVEIVLLKSVGNFRQVTESPCSCSSARWGGQKLFLPLCKTVREESHIARKCFKKLKTIVLHVGFYSPDQFYFLFRVYDSSLFCHHYFVLEKKKITLVLSVSLIYLWPPSGEK